MRYKTDKRFFPISLMEKAIEKLENQIRQVEEASDDESHINWVRRVNNSWILELISAIAYLRDAKEIPKLDGLDLEED